MSFLIKLFCLYLLFLVIRFFWRIGRAYYLLQKQMQEVDQQSSRGAFRASPWSFVFTTRRGFGRAARPAEEETTANPTPPPTGGGEVIDAQFRVLSEKDDN